MKFQCKKCKRRITEFNSNSDVAKQKLCPSCLKGDKRADAAVPCSELLAIYSPRTLLLMIGYYTHTIDELEENGASVFKHEIQTDQVRAEVQRMQAYLEKYGR